MTSKIVGKVIKFQGFINIPIFDKIPRFDKILRFDKKGTVICIWLATPTLIEIEYRHRKQCLM